MRIGAGEHRAPTASAPAPQHSVDVFVGRVRELAELSKALQEAVEGRGSVAVLVGEAGIGKSRTAHELAASAGARGVTVLRGRCYEGEETPPFGPWRAALRPLPLQELAPEAASVVSALPGEHQAALPAAEARIRLFDAVIEILRAAATRHAVLLVLDNLQWADPGSLKLLQHLCAEMEDSRILVLGTYRDSDLDDRHPLRLTLAELAKERRFRRIALAGLTPAEVGEYLSRTVGTDPTAALVREVHQRTEGNPLFVVELVRDMSEADRGRPRGHRIPPGVKEAIGARLARLPEETVGALSAASVIGRVFGIDVLCRLVGDASGDGVLRIIETAKGAGFVQEIPDEAGHYRFGHVLVQETLLDGIPGARRARYHADIAGAMAELAGGDIDGKAAAIAHHLAEAGDAESLARLVPYTLRAAEHALASLAPDQAVSLLDRALRIKERAPHAGADAEVAELLYRKGRALDEMAVADAAAQSLTQAFDLFSTLGDVSRMVDVALQPVQRPIRMGQSVTWSYADSGLPDLRRRALAAVKPESIEEGRLLAGQPQAADIERALAIARREGDRKLEMDALWHLSYAHMCAGELDRSRAEEQEALAIAGRLGHRWGARYLLYWRCRRSTLQGDLHALQESAREMLQDAEREHSRLSLAAAHQACANVAHMIGDWDGCREHVRACLSLQLGRGETHSHTVTLATLALTELETGHAEAAEEHVRALGVVTGNPDAPYPFYLPKMAWITRDTRRIDAAAQALGRVEAAGPPFEWVTMSRDFACALIAVIRSDEIEAARYLEHYRPWTGLRIPWNASGMSSDGLLALLYATLGRMDQAVGAFEHALAFCRRSGFRPELARTCRDYGEALLRRSAPGDEARALEVLREGLAVGGTLGMTPLVEGIERAIERARQIESARRGHAYPNDLSQREVEVLRLVARGYTNAEIGEKLFISGNTVARHIQNLLDKTGMSNRTEATSYAYRHGLIED